MSDLEQIAEYIQNAIQAVDSAHKAANDLRENPAPESLDQFRKEAQVLTEHLTKLQTVLEHQEAFGLDELAGWLNQVFSGKYTEYRRTPRMESDVNKG